MFQLTTNMTPSDGAQLRLQVVLSDDTNHTRAVNGRARPHISQNADGRLGRIAILYVEGTSEDPRQGAHEDFVQFVIDAVDDVQVFDAGDDPVSVVDYVNDWHT